jgi:hypothetical protein
MFNMLIQLWPYVNPRPSDTGKKKRQGNSPAFFPVSVVFPLGKTRLDLLKLFFQKLRLIFQDVPFP